MVRAPPPAQLPRHQAEVISLIGTWDIVELADGWKIDGLGYGGRISPSYSFEGIGERLIYKEPCCRPGVWSTGVISGDGTYYVGHSSGKLFALRDSDGDGIIDEFSGEVSVFHGGAPYQGSMALAPGILATSPCSGLQVFRSSDSSGLIGMVPLPQQHYSASMGGRHDASTRRK